MQHSLNLFDLEDLFFSLRAPCIIYRIEFGKCWSHELHLHLQMFHSKIQNSRMPKEKSLIAQERITRPGMERDWSWVEC